MGTTSYMVKVSSPKKELEKIINSLDVKILESKIKNAIMYAAVQNKNGFVDCIIIKFKNNPYFEYKIMDESEYPYYFDCPVEILNLLSVTDNKLANDWRKACLNNFNDNPKNNIGKIICFEKPLMINGIEAYEFLIVKEVNSIIYRSNIVGGKFKINLQNLKGTYTIKDDFTRID